MCTWDEPRILWTCCACGEASANPRCWSCGHAVCSPPQRHRRLLLLSTPRAGSKFTAKVLAAHGMRIRHEALDHGGIVSSLGLCADLPHQAYDYDDDGRAIWAYLDYAMFDTIALQVRHPLPTVASLAAWRVRFPGPAGTVDRYLRWTTRPRTEIEWAAEVYSWWNKECSKYAAFSYAVEDLDAAIVTRLSGLPGNAKILEKVSTKTNTINHGSLDPGDIPGYADLLNLYGKLRFPLVRR